MKQRWLALAALSLAVAACARSEPGAALNDATPSAPLTGDSAAISGPAAVQAAQAAAATADSSTAATTATVDSALGAAPHDGAH